jgi:hypothetical protein
MDVRVDSWAWLPKSELEDHQLTELKRQLTITPRKVGDHPGDPPEPIQCFTEENGHIGVPRSYYLENQRDHHNVTLDFNEGDMDDWPGDLVFEGKLEPDQEKAVSTLVAAFLGGCSGGILQAAPGWGKTVATTALIARLNVPTLVTVHKTFLLNQWKRRIATFLPDAKVGIVRQGKCDYEGKHICIAINTSLHVRQYPPEFYDRFGLIISDEVHRIGAPTWSQIPQKFKAKWRTGLSATPRRSDGAHTIFHHHIGPVLFRGSVERMPCQIKRVWNEIHIPEGFRLNPTLLKSTLATKLLCANGKRNESIIDALIRAVQAGRKVMVMSGIRHRHLVPLEAKFKALWPSTSGRCPKTSFYVGGMKDAELEEAEKAQVIFATSQMAKEGLDIPPLDTLFLTTPMGNVEQAVGRIQRPYPGKKDPIVVDFRDDNIAVCRRLGELREKFYERKGWTK